MTRHFSPEDHLSRLTQTWIGNILLMGAVLFPVLEFMDYFVSPHLFMRFMLYRLVISAILVLLYFLNRLHRSKLYQYVIAAIGATLSAVTVEIAVLQSGGQSSVYYAAMMILTICCLGFAPMGMSLSFLLVAIVYTIYVVPIFMTEEITSGVFVSNNAFLISMFVIGLLLRYSNQKLLKSELQLRAELSDDKAQLETLVTAKAGELAITEQKYRELFDNAHDGIAVLDRSGNITDVNRRFCELHGFDRESAVGTNIRLIEIEQRKGDVDDRLQKIMRGELLVYEAEHFRKEGSRVFLEISSRAIDIGGVTHIQSFYRDITEKMKLREQVLQSQKMESMGVLAGGIAHDFNNVLTAILSHTEVLRRRLAGDAYGRERVATIENAARRSHQMVSKLLSFARKERLELVPIRLNDVVKDAAELLGRTFIDRNITARVVLLPDMPEIRGDGIHLEQVLANLAMNAMDAMPGGGTLTITTGRREISGDAKTQYPFLPAGDYAVLAVSDTGTGISRENLDRIFDPFFTTKPAGKGTGLGLATSYGIVKSHGGEIRVESKVGEGTTFEIYLPLSAEKSAPTEESHTSNPSVSAS